MILIESKFSSSIPSHTIQRIDLIQTLNQAKGLTVVQAPAGYGKTTLLQQWMQQSDAKITWLSLDVDDNEKTQFLSYIAATLFKIEPMFEPLIDTHTDSDYLTRIANTIKRHITDSICLVIDNYDVIFNDEIHESMIFLLKHTMPQLHLMLISRSQPPLSIASLRAQGLLTEITASDLCFSQDETNAYFTDCTDLTLTAEQVKNAYIQTDGWIAIVQILVARLKKLADVNAVIQDFSGQDRFVSD